MNKINNPKKKLGGPNTNKGKLISSQNAIKTGVTTKQLLSEHEFSRFNQLKENLSNYYQGENPLIQMQIEKIARLQIQLERIQNAIDALYRKSEMQPLSKNKKDFSDHDSEILRLHLLILLGLLDESALAKIEKGLLGIRLKGAFEKPSLNKSQDEENHKPIVTQQSLLGAYLFAESSYYQQDLTNYLKDKGSAITNSRSSKELYQKLNLEVLTKAIDLMKSPDLSDSIAMDNHYEFHQFNNWFEQELAKLPEQLRELRLLMKQKENPINIPIPNFDDLDRLMRYQTNISRQLSTAIGELMVLAK